MESSWEHAKREFEFVHGPVKELTRSQLSTIIFDSVEVFYARERHQVTLEYGTR